MKTKRFILTVGAVVLGLTGLSAHAVPSLYLAEYGINIDGDTSPAGVDISSFDTFTGLGTITATVTGIGAHSFDAFFDHEIDESVNTFFNESGAATGVAAAGQSWEIDEPGYLFGDIYDNFLDSTLDNSNAVPAGLEDDVSMALGWDFMLAAGETATISLLLDETVPGGFHLSHTDADSGYTFYLSSILEIDGGVPTPEPSMLYLLGIGIIGLVVNRRRSLNQA